MTEVILTDNSTVCKGQQVEEWTPAKVIYAGLIGINLISFIWLLVTGSSIEMPPIVLLMRTSTAILAFFLGKLWKDRGFQILLAYTILFVMRVFIPNPENLFCAEISESIFCAIWLFAGCYGFAKILNRFEIKKILYISSCIWILCITVLCFLGIITACTGQSFALLNNASINIDANRLSIAYLPTVTGALIGLSIIIAFVLLFTEKKRYIKIFLFFAIPIMITSLALTDSRTAFFCFAAGAGLEFVFIILEQLSQRYFSKSKISLWINRLLLYILIFALLLFILTLITPVFNHLKTNGLFSHANAETIQDNQIQSRGFNGDRVLSGRKELWAEIIDYMWKHPLLLLTGESKINPLRNIRRYHWYGYGHSHNIIIQIFIESGLPGLFILLLFGLYSLKKITRVIRNADNERWIRLLPGILIYLFVGEMTECFIWFRSAQCPMSTTLFLIISILTNVQTTKTEQI